LQFFRRNFLAAELEGDGAGGGRCARGALLGALGNGFRHVYGTQTERLNLSQRVRPAAGIQHALGDFAVGLQRFVGKGGHDSTSRQRATAMVAVDSPVWTLVELST